MTTWIIVDATHTVKVAVGENILLQYCKYFEYRNMLYGFVYLLYLFTSCNAILPYSKLYYCIADT